MEAQRWLEIGLELSDENITLIEKDKKGNNDCTLPYVT